jgi:hypothetical protein
MHKHAVGYKHFFFVLMQPPLTVKLRAGMPEAALRETINNIKKK